MAGVKGRSGGARPNTGGARPGAGRPKKKPEIIDAKQLLTDDPRRFLIELMNNPAADIKLRADAAKALLAADLRASVAKGKKEERQGAAQEATGGRFAPSSPPKLVVNNK
jgi:phage terminase small subunit